MISCLSLCLWINEMNDRYDRVPHQPKNEANSENSPVLSESLTPKNKGRGAPDSAIRSYF